METLPILICGSGPAGLLLGHVLKKGGLPFAIYERDAALSARAQGYRFRLTGDAVIALQDILSPSHFAHLRASSATPLAGAKITNIDAITGESVPGGPPLGSLNLAVEPLLVDRTVFRSVLGLGLEDHMRFGKEVVGYDLPAGEAAVVARFADASTAKGSVLVGADGSWSKVRRQHLPELVPVDTEARWIFGKTAITPALRERLDARLLQSMQLVADKRLGPPLTLLSEPMQFTRRSEVRGINIPADYVYWVLGSRSDRLDTTALPRAPSSQVCADLSLEITADWQPALRGLFELQDEGATSLLRIPTMKPPLPHWEPGRVVLVGDAAHCMSPTGAQGATTALMDVARLGKLFIEEGVSVESVGKYEAAMREWADKAITISRMGGVKFIGMREFDELKPFAADKAG